MFTEIKLKIIKWRYFELSFLLLLFLIGFLLRTYQIDNNLFFGPEQGRDMLVVKDIVENHKLVLIGPKTDINGIFHGPIFYYLATIPFIVSKGNPLFISFFFIFLNGLSVFLIYSLAKELLGKRVGLISASLLTFSFGAIAMARWFSNPPLVVPLSCLFFWFLAKFLKGRNIYLLPMAIMFGLLCQLEFVNLLIFSIILLLVMVIFRKRFLKGNPLNLIISFLALLVFTFGNFLLFDLRHKFLITGSILKLLTSKSVGSGTLVSSLLGSFDNFIHISYDSVSPFYPVLAVILIILGLMFVLRNKDKMVFYLLSIWIVAPFIAFAVVKYNSLYHFFGMVIIAVIILTAVVIERLYLFKKTLGYLLIGLLIAINLLAFKNSIFNNQNVFFQSSQPDLKYADQKIVIKKIYSMSSGKPFSIQSYTIPYWMQDGWTYLFWYYGQAFGYAPTNNENKLFVIIQDDPNGKLYQDNWLKDTVAGWGIKENEFRQGALRVQMLKVR